MIALGIDPGIAICGYGLVREERDGSLTSLAFGTIETPKEDALPARLRVLRDRLTELVKEWRPAESSVEALFFATNAKTAMAVGQARGVILLTLADCGLSIAEYTPLQVKQTLTGYGQADKKQMQEMVRMRLNLSRIPKPDDAADALAIAITHIQSRRWNMLGQTAG